MNMNNSGEKIKYIRKQQKSNLKISGNGYMYNNIHKAPIDNRQQKY